MYAVTCYNWYFKCTFVSTYYVGDVEFKDIVALSYSSHSDDSVQVVNTSSSDDIPSSIPAAFSLQQLKQATVGKSVCLLVCEFIIYAFHTALMNSTY